MPLDPSPVPSIRETVDGSLSVLIVSYNVRQELAECLASLFASKYPYELQIVVVDNASRDGTPAMLRTTFPGVELIANETNMGFPAANNQALRLARGNFVLYLNPDTLVPDGTLTACVEYLLGHPDIGLLGCRVLYPDGRIQYECARNFPSLETLFWEALYLQMLLPHHPRFGKNLMADWDHLDSRDVPCLIGAFMLASRTLLQELGGMDESVFLFLDDIDLCYRIRRAGWRIHYLADPTIIHRTGRSRRGYAGNLSALNAEAKYQFFQRHHGTRAASLCRLVLGFKGMYRLALGVPLALAVRLYPGLESGLGGAADLNKHWQLVRWAVTKPASGAIR